MQRLHCIGICIVVFSYSQAAAQYFGPVTDLPRAMGRNDLRTADISKKPKSRQCQDKQSDTFFHHS